ncbi:YdeI/OmpD-associated family protein [Pseudoxanthomonas sp. PXM01]|uniref:YdeI/OmpD-associated family protein n=1 Tax=Pseudoxanthomonas sp. PXM01 TaxID=2769295 RepID=UPI0017837F65|nr:YdeI/OmpD-associated family protein [Pseudoxanthomonas sp. PXM01]MBD9467927.1 YdeI/OmpD-associated family protein [Pseudoxanthomonas sp. PXM01]
MSAHDPRVDAYIAKAAPFARPLLEHLRAVVHAACPSVQEDIKWSMPSFQYGGRILCQMAAFKQHASFGFWQHAAVTEGKARDGMGSLGRLATIKDVPSKRELTALLRKAMALIDEGATSTAMRAKPAPRAALEVPADLRDALAGNPGAKAAFDSFSASARRDYIEWITGAKREDTRARRLAQAVEWLAEGKMRNWKYAKPK